jgi:hypothetical protein
MATGAGRAQQNDTIYFGEFELDLSAQTLLQGGVPVKLQRQPFEVLELLVKRAPVMVSREEIRRHVWGDAVYIDASQSINFCIHQIRLALGDTSAGARFVEICGARRGRPRKDFHSRTSAHREGAAHALGTTADSRAGCFCCADNLVVLVGMVAAAEHRFRSSADFSHHDVSW